MGKWMGKVHREAQYRLNVGRAVVLHLKIISHPFSFFRSHNNVLQRFNFTLSNRLQVEELHLAIPNSSEKGSRVAALK
jgi:hypothetical protein